MEDNKNNLPTEETVRQMLMVQASELEIRKAEIHADAADLNNQKEIALKAIETQSKDRAGDRDTFQRESTKSKLFIFGLVLVFVFVICFLVVHGHKDLVTTLLVEAAKVLLGAFGGAGVAVYYLKRNSKISDDF